MDSGPVNGGYWQDGPSRLEFQGQPKNRGASSTDELQMTEQLETYAGGEIWLRFAVRRFKQSKCREVHQCPVWRFRA
jgi:hypothetical protein